MPELDNEGVIEADSGEPLPMGDAGKEVGTILVGGGKWAGLSCSFEFIVLPFRFSCIARLEIYFRAWVQHFSFS